MVVLKEFPNSKEQPFIQTSPEDSIYNCIAWAAGDNTKWYEPDPGNIYFWPSVVSRQYSINSYVELYEHFGFIKCDNGKLEPDFEKVVLFSKDGFPTHAARQLPDGLWTSKLGKNIDVSHTIEAMEGGFYGNVIQYLKKERQKKS